ncbi:unnamed protein product [Mesocestoides corti]|nr:unnamed protein product [Mesocestoides corti]
MVVDASGMQQEKEGKEAMHHCLSLLHHPSRHNASNLTYFSKYVETWESIPTYRFVGLCPGDPPTVGMLLEMQAQLSFMYKTKNGETRCQIVRLAPPAANSSTSNTVVPRNATRPASLVPVDKKRRHNLTSSMIISESALTTCDNKTREMGVYLDPVGGLPPWVIRLTWRRKAEYYEDGEVGWSSVGAHVGALSGTFSLTKVQLDYSLSLFPDADPAEADGGLVAVRDNMERFRARAGDFYQCVSSRHILLTAPPTGNLTTSIDTTKGPQVILTTRSIRLQSFSDNSQNKFTGSGVTCGDDVHEDHTLTIGIGASVFIVVVVSAIGIILTRLYDRDKELQSYEVEYMKMTSKGLLPPVPASTGGGEARVIGKASASPA